MEHFEVRSDLPYPSLENISYNPYYAGLLQSDYAGCNGEFTAISDYVYQHIWFEDKNLEYSKVIEKIAIVEMNHLDFLGKAIIKLGGDPKIGCCNVSKMFSYWSGSVIHYEKNLKNAILSNIDAEQKAIYNYCKHIKMIEDASIKELLNRIILDEKVHITVFEKLYNKYCI